jgi:hypothetical protein
MRLNQKGFSIFGLLFKLAFLLLIYYVIVRVYFSLIFDHNTRHFLDTQGIKTASVEGMVESVKSKVDEINKALAEREKDVEKLFGQGK